MYHASKEFVRVFYNAGINNGKRHKQQTHSQEGSGSGWTGVSNRAATPPLSENHTEPPQPGRLGYISGYALTRAKKAPSYAYLTLKGVDDDGQASAQVPM